MNKNIPSDVDNHPPDASKRLRVSQEQADHAAIREGFAQMEAGGGRPTADVDADIREEFGFPPRT